MWAVTGCSGRTPVDVVFSLSDQAGVKETDQVVDFISSVVQEAKISPVQVQVCIL